MVTFSYNQTKRYHGHQCNSLLWSDSCRRSVVLMYWFGRCATHTAYRLFCALSSFRRAATVVATVFLRNRGVVSLVAFWHRLAASIFAVHIGYVFSEFLMFHTLLLNLGERRHFYLLAKRCTLHVVDSRVLSLSSGRPHRAIRPSVSTLLSH